MHEGIYFENSIPVAWPYCSKFCTNSCISCVASAWTSTFLQRSLLCWHLSFPTCNYGKQTCVLEPRSCLKYSRGSKSAQINSLQPGSDFSQNSMFTWTHQSKAEREQQQHESHTVLLAYYLQIKFSLCSKLSAGTQLMDFIFHSCTASFCPCQQQKSYRKVVSNHGGNWRGGDILSYDLKGVLQTKLSTHSSWHFRTGSEGWFPQAQIMYHLWMLIPVEACQEKIAFTSREKLKPVWWSSWYILA